MPRRDEKSHFYQLARLAIALSVGEVPSVASALPSCRVVIKPVDLLVGAAGWHGILNRDGGASMRIWGEGICSDAARRVAIKGAAIVYADFAGAHFGMRAAFGLRRGVPRRA